MAFPIDSLETIHIQIPEKTFNGAEIPNKLEEIPTKYDKEGRPVEPRPSDDPKDPLVCIHMYAERDITDYLGINYFTDAYLILRTSQIKRSTPSWLSLRLLGSSASSPRLFM